MNRIPFLDISKFGSDPNTFVSEFGKAYAEWGFAGITGHGIDSSNIKAALSAAEDFFALPLTQKQQYLCPETTARGYIPFGIEKAKDAKHSDLKEFFHLGREITGVAHLKANIWPTEITDFKTAYTTLYAALDDLAHTVLQVVSLYLGLPQNYFESRINHGETLLRILHYPPITNEDTPHVRAAAHEDINLLTLLVGSEQDGLEVLSRMGEWVPINMIDGAIICNVGDMLQRLTNAKLPSTTHRVVNPKGDKRRISRYSIPFFVHPNPEMPLNCLPQCVSSNNPARYADINAEEFHHQRLREIGLLK